MSRSRAFIEGVGAGKNPKNGFQELGAVSQEPEQVPVK